MLLSLSPAARTHLGDALIGLSLGNLCLLRSWYAVEHVAAPGMDYYRDTAADSTRLLATLVAATLLAGGLWMAVRLVRRIGNPHLLKLARVALLLLSIFPLETVRRYWNVQAGHADLTNTLLVGGVEVLLLFGATLAMVGNLRVVHAAQRTLAYVAILLPLFLANVAWLRSGASTSREFQFKRSLPPLPARAARGAHSAPRVIWVVFDELDQRLAFDQRQPGVELPQLDRLRAESLVANHAEQTAGATLSAIPSLLSGRIFPSATTVDYETLLLQPAGGGPMVNWRGQSNVFQRARLLGVNTALAGWHHPYCRVLGDSLTRCFQAPGAHLPELQRDLNATQNGIRATVSAQFHREWAALLDVFLLPDESVFEKESDIAIQRQQQQQFFAIRDRGYRDATDPQVDFLFLHIPAPHLFALYDRKRKDFVLSGDTNYFDNLALVDRVVGELRQKLEAAELWDSTSLLITADHGLRREQWHGHLGWNKEFDRLLANGSSPTVPFILKLAGRSDGVIYDQPLSNVVSGDLSLAVLSGAVATPQQAADWVATNTGELAVSAARLRH